MSTPETPTAGQDGEKCTVPPKGWYCTREKGHKGPCAASPTRPSGSISFCSHPGCGYPDGKPCHGCGAVVPKGLTVMVHSDHKERNSLASQLAQAQRQIREEMQRNAEARAELEAEVKDAEHRTLEVMKVRDRVEAQLAQAQRVNDALLRDNVEMSYRVGEVRSQLAQAQGERDAAIHERESCHAIYDRILALCGYEKGQGYPGLEGAVKKVCAELTEARAECERLREEASHIIRGGSIVEERDRLREENEGLRAALEEIVANQVLTTPIATMARAAIDAAKQP